MAKRSIKSRTKSKVQSEIRKQFSSNLTPNQKEFIKQTRRLEREIKSVAKRIEHPLTEDDILSLLPVNPKKITKTYLKKLAKQTAKELLAGVLGENPIAREVAEKVVDVVAENVTPADDEDVSRETPADDEEDIPRVGIVERVASHIQSIPDYIQFRSHRYKTWMPYDLTEDKKLLLDAIVYDDWYSLTKEEQQAIVDNLTEHEAQIMTLIDHIPLVSDQDDYNTTYGTLLNLLNRSMVTYGNMTRMSNLTDMLGE